MSKRNSIRQKLENHGGRFTSVSVRRAKTGVQNYCARVISVGASQLRFYDVNSQKNITVPLKNVL